MQVYKSVTKQAKVGTNNCNISVHLQDFENPFTYGKHFLMILIRHKNAL